ncbi:unnamed protein product [Prorocentrum cordatum]|uniref:Centrosomal protein POC5 n=1 Tax=Prorocentrum cordatum TaxID=2364126 RepID=A0ABN9PKW4_9DINO|nr:unnamed protein product [Polarella glacialis]
MCCCTLLRHVLGSDVRRQQERLEREAADCQDKIHALRKENLRLVEKCAELQAEIPDSPRRLSSSIGSGRMTDRPSSAGTGAGAALARRSASASPAAQLPGGLGTPAAAARGGSRLDAAAPAAGGAPARPGRAPAGAW